MVKAARTQYVCQSCGAIAPRWAGRCDACGAWNTLLEETSELSGIGGRPAKAAASKAGKARKIELVPLQGGLIDNPRMATGIQEFDRACGGGLVPGSVVLVGGDPGIGKSTLLIQVMAALAKTGAHAVYISGEEAIAQIKLRSQRLGIGDAPVELGAETNLNNIIRTLDNKNAPDALVIDSIQTMWSQSLDAAPGTVSQVRTCAQDLVRLAKKHNTAIILVGHVTKDGQIAGPKVIEHMVDTVLYFEGDRGHHFRILRAVKNRYGPVDEIGVFEMTGRGLSEVANPSVLFLGERDTNATGTAVLAGIEGTRPLLVEIQALVAPASFGTPRRAVVGWDSNRLAMILAVLDAHCGVSLGNHDVYLNIAGGLKISEPAADLAVAAALISSLTGKALSTQAVYFGEISLSGKIRAVAQTPARLKEAAKLGFKTATIPDQAASKATGDLPGLTLNALNDLTALVARIST